MRGLSKFVVMITIAVSFLLSGCVDGLYAGEPPVNDEPEITEPVNPENPDKDNESSGEDQTKEPEPSLPSPDEEEEPEPKPTGTTQSVWVIANTLESSVGVRHFQLLIIDTYDAIVSIRIENDEGDSREVVHVTRNPFMIETVSVGSARVYIDVFLDDQTVVTRSIFVKVL